VEDPEGVRVDVFADSTEGDGAGGVSAANGEGTLHACARNKVKKDKIQTRLDFFNFTCFPK